MPTFNGTADADTLIGTAGDDTINGLAGDDRLNGAGGIDHLYGGLGNDVFVVDNLSDRPVEAVGEGSDTVFTSTSYWLSDQQSIERLGTISVAGTEAIHLAGNSFDQTLTGNAGDNVLNGGGGVDTLIGYAGNDAYIVDNANAKVIEAVSDQGSDTVLTTVSYTLGAGQSVEYLATVTMDNGVLINLTGNELAQTVRGDFGSNILDGGGGGDTLIGSYGDDTFIVRSSGDHVVELANQGVDTVEVFASFTLRTNQSIEVIQAADAASTVGLHLTGNNLAQMISGDAGNDTLSSGGGDDTLQGGLGNDRYIVATPDTQVMEGADQGSDTIYTSVSYALTQGQSVETLATTARVDTTAIDLTGTDQAETIIGNNGANHLNGVSGSDTLYGYDGDDTLSVSASSGIADGGSGSDVLQIVFSNVSFYSDISHLKLVSVEVLDTDGNTVDLTSAQASSFKTIESTSPNANIAFLSLADAGVVDFSSKMAAGISMQLLLEAPGNVINASNNGDTIFAGAGNDTIIGGTGNDVIRGDLGHAVFSGGDGDDTVGTFYPADNGTFVLSGNNGNDLLLGGHNADLMAGGDGNDRIVSSGGQDTIEGGAGSDTIDATTLSSDDNRQEYFVYAQVSDSTGAAHDLVIAADLDRDHFVLPTKPVSLAAMVTAGRLDLSSFDHDMTAAVGAAQLGAHQAVLFAPDSGDLHNDGHVFLVIDANGVAGYQAGQDYVIELQDATGTLTLADFS